MIRYILGTLVVASLVANADNAGAQQRNRDRRDQFRKQFDRIRNTQDRRNNDRSGNRNGRNRGQNNRNRNQGGDNTRRSLEGRTLIVDGVDRVQFDERNGPEGAIRFRMNTDGTTWWKAIAVVDKNGRKTWIERQDGGYLTTDTIEMSRNRFGDEVKVEFWKAKFLGVHTYMQTWNYPTSLLVGRQLTILWHEGEPLPPAELAPPSGSFAISSNPADGTVRVTTRPLPAKGRVRFEIDSTVDWWNGIKIVDNRGIQMWIELEAGEHLGNQTIEVPISRFDSNVKVEFWKAKALGVHTYMKTRTFATKSVDGQIVKFDWEGE